MGLNIQGRSERGLVVSGDVPRNRGGGRLISSKLLARRLGVVVSGLTGLRNTCISERGSGRGSGRLGKLLSFLVGGSLSFLIAGLHYYFT